MARLALVRELSITLGQHSRGGPACTRVGRARRVESVIKKAVLIAREVGSAYIQAYTSCNIEYAIPTDKVMEDAKNVENDRYQFTEYVSEEAKQYLAERYGYKEFLPKPAAPAGAIPNKA